MKKILLTMVALMAMAFTASADEPTYTAKGTTGGYYTAYNYTAIYAGEPTVEVYLDGNGVKEKVIVRSWCGVDGYDMAIIYTSSSDGVGATDAYPIINGEEKIPSTTSSYSYVDTGLATNYVVACFGKSSIYTWQSDDTKTEYVWFAPWMFTDTECTSYLSGNYEYYLSWSVPESAGINGVTANAENENAPMYNLAGQRVSKNAKGLVIKNGKKMILK